MSASEVSAFEPQPPAEPKLDLPQFPVVRRGFDRHQVEAWSKELTSQIQQQQRRADQAEQALYRMQLEQPATPSFTHLGSHAAGIIEEAGRSAERMLLDAAERAQEAIDGAGGDAAEIVEAAEGRAGGIEQAARQDAEQLRAEGARVAQEAHQAAVALRAQAEQDARSLLEDAREATDRLWQEAERERVAVEGETGRLEGLRQRSHQQLGRMYGHLESVLEEVRLGIGGAQDLEEEAAPEPVPPGQGQTWPAAEPATGGRRARPAKAETLPTVAEA